MKKTIFLKKDSLQQHARTVPAHMGYTHEQFVWRDAIQNILNAGLGPYNVKIEHSNGVTITTNKEGQSFSIDIPNYMIVGKKDVKGKGRK